jgi:hypothetical protein
MITYAVNLNFESQARSKPMLDACPAPAAPNAQVLGDQVARRGGVVGEALLPMLDRTLAEVRGRIIYRCQVRGRQVAPWKAWMNTLSVGRAVRA